MQSTEIELTADLVNQALKRQFIALEKGFQNPDVPGEGTIKAYEFIEQLTAMIEDDPMMLRTVFTEKNLNALRTLQEKQKTGNVGIMDFMEAFPEVGKGLKGMLNPFKSSK